MITRDEFLALLARLNGDGDALTAEELRAVAQYVAANGGSEDTPADRELLTDEELATVSEAVRQLGADDDLPLDELEAAVEVIDAADPASEFRDAEADAATQRREELRARLAGEPAPVAEGEGEGEGETPPAEGEGEGETPPEETPPAKGEGETPPASHEPVPAAASRTAPRARPAGVAASRRPSGALRTQRERSANRIMRDGGEFADLRELSEAMLARREGFMHVPDGLSERIIMGAVLADYPEDRVLDPMNASLNAATLERVLAEMGGGTGRGVNADELEAATASGGFCAPRTPYYGIAQLAESDQPMKASLVGFQATRGGITFRQPPDFRNFTGAIGKWTATNDATPGSQGPATKPVLTVPCLGTTTADIYAVTTGLRFGNFMAMADPETVENATKNTLAAFAATSEQYILDAIKAASTIVQAGQAFGAFRDLLFHWGVTAVGYRNRRRMRADAVIELRCPAWVRDMIREDVARSLNAYPDQYAMADDFISRALSVRNIRPYWYIDTPTVDGVAGNRSQVFGAQAAGGIDDFPAYVQWQMSPPGTFVFLENGRIDLGVVRDSTLNATNDYQTFAESFEGVAQLGFQSIWGQSDVCPNGASAGTTAPDLVCTSGGDYIPTGSTVGAFIAP